MNPCRAKPTAMTGSATRVAVSAIFVKVSKRFSSTLAYPGTAFIRLPNTPPRLPRLSPILATSGIAFFMNTENVLPLVTATANRAPSRSRTVPVPTASLENSPVLEFMIVMASPNNWYTCGCTALCSASIAPVALPKIGRDCWNASLTVWYAVSCRETLLIASEAAIPHAPTAMVAGMTTAPNSMIASPRMCHTATDRSASGRILFRSPPNSGTCRARNPNAPPAPAAAVAAVLVAPASAFAATVAAARLPVFTVNVIGIVAVWPLALTAARAATAPAVTAPWVTLNVIGIVTAWPLALNAARAATAPAVTAAVVTLNCSGMVALADRNAAFVSLRTAATLAVDTLNVTGMDALAVANAALAFVIAPAMLALLMSKTTGTSTPLRASARASARLVMKSDLPSVRDASIEPASNEMASAPHHPLARPGQFRPHCGQVDHSAARVDSPAGDTRFLQGFPLMRPSG